MLIGKRIKLRPVEESDLPLLVQWRNQPETWAGFFNKFPLSRSRQVTWFKNVSEDRHRVFLMIETLNSAETIGTVGFDRIDPTNQAAELGNVLIGPKDFKHKGLAREAALLLLAYGFERLNLHRIFLNVMEDNKPAVRLYQQCGFKREGCQRQAFYDQGGFKNVWMMGLLKGEFAKLKKSA